VILALTTACFTVSSVHRLHGEEEAGRAELVLSTPTRRSGWQFGWLTVTALGTVVVLVATGAGVAVTDAVVSGTAERTWSTLGATLGYLPAVGVIGGLAAALHGWLPRFSVLAWVVLAGCFVNSWLGGLLGFPDRVMNLSPFTLTPRMPLEEIDWPVVAGLAGLALALLVLAVVGLRRRDVDAEV
jgi:ABC-2 type transport system permease protein